MHDCHFNSARFVSVELRIDDELAIATPFARSGTTPGAQPNGAEANREHRVVESGTCSRSRELFFFQKYFLCW